MSLRDPRPCRHRFDHRPRRRVRAVDGDAAQRGRIRSRRAGRRGTRRNIYAAFGKADVVLSTHLDCVPPFFPSRLDGDKLLRPRFVRREGSRRIPGGGAGDAAPRRDLQRRAAVRGRRRAGQRRCEDRAGAGIGIEISDQRRADRQPARHRHAGRPARATSAPTAARPIHRSRSWANPRWRSSSTRC